MPSAPIAVTEQLAVGNIVMVAVELKDKRDGTPFWWRRFCYVNRITGKRHAEMVTMKMVLDPDKDIREVDVGKDVVTILESSEIPQGVSAMVMKHLALGKLKTPV